MSPVGHDSHSMRLTLSSVPMVTLDHQRRAATILASLLAVNDCSLNGRPNALLPPWCISAFIYTHKSSSDNVLNQQGPFRALPQSDAPTKYSSRAANLQIIMFKCRLKWCAGKERQGHNEFFVPDLMVLALCTGVLCKLMRPVKAEQLSFGASVELMCFLSMCTCGTSC